MEHGCMHHHPARNVNCNLLTILHGSPELLLNS